MTLPLKAIPTNIITGFLGVGKTTAITHLLKTKPSNECWAILVNEFGEVGIDGTMFKTEKQQKQDVFISEVPGGCMCCAAGLPMQIALNMLLKKARPDRLLIEPTGLGHPKEVMQVLSAAHYRDVLALNSTITLVDARKLTDTRYTNHDTFNQQLEIADVVVANKNDLYRAKDLLKLVHFLGNPSRVKPIFPVSHGKIELSWLTGLSEWRAKEQTIEKQAETNTSCAKITSVAKAHSHNVANARSSESVRDLKHFKKSDFNERGFIAISNQGEGYFSKGWVFHPDVVFDGEKLNALLLKLKTERAKGVFITEEGILGFNKTEDIVPATNLDESVDSRIELISSNDAIFNDFEERLLRCATL